MKVTDLIENQIDEGIKDAAKSIAAAGVVGSMLMGKNFAPPDQEPKTTHQTQIDDYSDEDYSDVKAPYLSPWSEVSDPEAITNSELEIYLRSEAIRAGIRGKELAQFLAQMKHESWNFTKMEEHEKRPGYFRRYDIQYAPARAKRLGNTDPGDGKKYRGRGYIQLTGKYNYAKVGQALGIDLVTKPHLASDPKIAADVAIYYWQQRVQPNVEDFSNTKQVTRFINSALRGLDTRDMNFKSYLETIRS